MLYKFVGGSLRLFGNVAATARIAKTRLGLLSQAQRPYRGGFCKRSFLIGAFAEKNGPDGSKENVQIQPYGPVLNVVLHHSQPFRIARVVPS